MGHGVVRCDITSSGRINLARNRKQEIGNRRTNMDIPIFNDTCVQNISSKFKIPENPLSSITLNFAVSSLMIPLSTSWPPAST